MSLPTYDQGVPSRTPKLRRPTISVEPGHEWEAWRLTRDKSLYYFLLNPADAALHGGLKGARLGATFAQRRERLERRKVKEQLASLSVAA